MTEIQIRRMSGSHCPVLALFLLITKKQLSPDSPLIFHHMITSIFLALPYFSFHFLKPNLLLTWNLAVLKIQFCLSTLVVCMISLFI